MPVMQVSIDGYFLLFTWLFSLDFLLFDNDDGDFRLPRKKWRRTLNLSTHDWFCVKLTGVFFFCKLP